MQQAGLATLLFDLLTAEEERRDQGLRFAIPLLAERVIGAIDWASIQAELRHLPIGLFGASTGAAAALIAAAAHIGQVGAVVSRGSRPAGGGQQLTVIGGAGHLFEQPGTLEQVADAAVDWFSRQLAQRA